MHVFTHVNDNTRVNVKKLNSRWQRRNSALKIKNQLKQ